MTLLSVGAVALLGVFLSVALLIRPERGAPVISAYTIVLGLTFIYQFLPAALLVVLNGSRYVWLPELGGPESVARTALTCVLAIVLFVVGYLSTRPKRQVTRKQACVAGEIRPVAWILLALGVLLKIYVYYASGGAEDSILRLSVGVRQSAGIDVLSPGLVFIRGLSGMADAAATWRLIESLRLKKYRVLSAILFFGVVGLTYFGAGKRLFLLWPILAAFLGVHYYVRRFRLADFPLLFIFLLGLGFLSLLFRIYAPATLASVEIDLNYVPWAEGSILKFYFFSLEFASFETLTLAMEEADQITALFGTVVDAFYVTNIQPLGYFVPRGLWPSKPFEYLDLSHAYRVFITGGALDSNGGIAATIIGTSWTLGGPVGLGVAMLGIGRLCRFLDSRQASSAAGSPLHLCWYAFSLVAVFHLFRQGTIAWTIIIVVMQQIGLIAGFITLTLVGRPARTSLVPRS